MRFPSTMDKNEKWIRDLLKVETRDNSNREREIHLRKLKTREKKRGGLDCRENQTENEQINEQNLHRMSITALKLNEMQLNPILWLKF